jgi:hypothetical protein
MRFSCLKIGERTLSNLLYQDLGVSVTLVDGFPCYQRLDGRGEE